MSDLTSSHLRDHHGHCAVLLSQIRVHPTAAPRLPVLTTHRAAWLLGSLLTLALTAAHAAPPQPVPSAPATLTARPVSATTTTYTVKTGDTLALLAQRFNTTVRELITMNNLTGTVIYVTQRLIVPATGSVTPVKPATPAVVVPSPGPAPVTPAPVAAPADTPCGPVQCLLLSTADGVRTFSVGGRPDLTLEYRTAAKGVPASLKVTWKRDALVPADVAIVPELLRTLLGDSGVNDLGEGTWRVPTWLLSECGRGPAKTSARYRLGIDPNPSVLCARGQRAGVDIVSLVISR